MQVIVMALFRAVEYATLGLGFGLIFSTTKIFHFVFGPIYAVASYAMLFFILNMAVPFPLALVMGLAFAVILAVLIQVIFYEPLLNRPNAALPLLITALGIFTIMQQLLALPFGYQSKELPNGLRETLLIQFGSITVTSTQVIVFVIELLVILLTLLLLSKTKFGLVVRAIGSDSDLAETLGSNLIKTRVLVMALGTALSGLAAIGTTMSVGVVSMSMPLAASLVATVAAFIGGMNKHYGPLLGGILLGFAQVFASAFISGTWSEALVYSALLIVILYRPRGLTGSKIGTLE